MMCIVTIYLRSSRLRAVGGLMMTVLGVNSYQVLSRNVKQPRQLDGNKRETLSQ